MSNLIEHFTDLIFYFKLCHKSITFNSDFIESLIHKRCQIKWPSINRTQWESARTMMKCSGFIVGNRDWISYTYNDDIILMCHELKDDYYTFSSPINIITLKYERSNQFYKIDGKDGLKEFFGQFNKFFTDDIF